MGPETRPDHRHLLHGLLSPRTATLNLTANIGCSECFRFRYVTNVNHCIVPKALIVPRSKSMRLRSDNGKNVRRKHSLQPVAAPLCAVRYCVNYNVSSPYSTCLCPDQTLISKITRLLQIIITLITRESNTYTIAQRVGIAHQSQITQ